MTPRRTPHPQFLVLLCALPAISVPALSAAEAQAQIIPAERRIEWAPGVPGGIPHYPVQNNALDFGAVGDGEADDTQAIKDALSATSVGNAVLLPEGTYRVTSQIGIPAGRVLRGEGPGRTRVVIQHSKSGFDISSSQERANTALAAAASKGDTTITVEDAAAFGPDSYAQLVRPSDEVSQIAHVAEVNGNQLTLARPLYESYEAGSSVDMAPMTRDAGIEDMFLYTDWPEHTGYVNATKVTLSRAARSWVKNIETDGYVGQEIFVTDCHQCEVRDSYFHQSLDGAMAEDQFYIYGVELRNGTTDTLVENNIFDFYRHAMLIQHDNAGGNVFGYNMSWSVYTRNEDNGQTIRSLQTDMEVHHQRVHQVLFEGNHAEYAAIHYSGDYEQTHNTLLRNRITQAGIDAATLNHVIGNELPDSKYVVVRDSWFPNNSVRVDDDSTIVHGNYVARDGGTQWDSSISDREIPASYYLEERPAWFCDLEWPAFGGDLMPDNTRRSPAEVRYWSIRFPELAPSDLTVTLEAGAANLSWTNNSENDVDFVVVRSSDGETFERIGTTGETSFVDNDIEEGADYFYYVRARNYLGGESGTELGGESAASNMVSTNPELSGLSAPDCGGAEAPRIETPSSGEDPTADATGAGGSNATTTAAATTASPSSTSGSTEMGATGSTGAGGSTTAAADAGIPIGASKQAEEGGCGCRTAPASSGVSWLAMLLGLSLLPLRRRKLGRPATWSSRSS